MMKEYIRYLPFGYSIASSFVAMCLEPIGDVMDLDLNSTDLANNMLTLGGEVVDRELRALVCDMYSLFTEYGMELA